MPTNVFDPSFITALKAEIAKQIATGDKVTRTTVLTALGYDSNTDLELSVSLVFRLGLVPEYKMFQKVGIKPADFQPKAKAPKKTRKKKEAPADEPSPETQASA